MTRIVIALALAFGLIPLPGLAGDADVAKVSIVKMTDGRYRVDVTVRHGDEDW